MKTVARIFSNKPCMMVLESSVVKSLKKDKIVNLDLEVDKECKLEFYIQKDDEIEKTLNFSLTPKTACATYIISVDWNNENVSCLQDSTDSTHRHLKEDPNNAPHCFIYDAKTFSLHHGVDAPYEYYGDFGKLGLAIVRYNINGSGFNPVYRYGVIDQNLKVVIPLEYTDIHIDDSGYILAHRLYDRVHCVLFDTEGKLLFEREGIEFFHITHSKPKIDHDGLIKITDPVTGCNGYINVENEIVIDTKYAGIIRFEDNDDLFVVGTASTNGVGVIDTDEKVVISFSYSEIHPIKQPNSGEYIYIVSQHTQNIKDSNRKYYILNSSEDVIMEQFDDYRIEGNLICLLKEEEWHFYNKDLSLLATYAQEDVRAWRWVGINVNGRWIHAEKVVFG